MIPNREGWNYSDVKNYLHYENIMVVFCGVLMPSEDTKILEFNQYRKSDKTPSIIYVHLEFLLKRTDEYKNIF